MCSTEGELVRRYPNICRTLAAWAMRWDLEVPDGSTTRIDACGRPGGRGAVAVHIERGEAAGSFLVPGDMEGADPGLLLSWAARRLDPIRRKVRPDVLPVLAGRYPTLARAMIEARLRWEAAGRHVSPRIGAREDGPGVTVRLEDPGSGRHLSLHIDPRSPSILGPNHLADLLDAGLSELLAIPV